MVRKKTFEDLVMEAAEKEMGSVPRMGTPESVEAMKRGRGRPRKAPAAEIVKRGKQLWPNKLATLTAERDLIEIDLRETRAELERCSRRGAYQTGEITRLNAELAEAKATIANQLEYIGKADRAVQSIRDDVVGARAQAEMMRTIAFPRPPRFPWDQR